MRRIPETASKRYRRRALPLPFLLLLFLAAVLLAPVFFPAEDAPDPDQAPTPAAAGIRSVTVSAEDRAGPPPDTRRFRGRPDAVFVYVVAGEEAEGLRAEVGRTGRTSLLGRLFSGGIEARQRPAGAPGVSKFEVAASSGGPLPTGRYAVTLYVGEGTEGAPAATEFFAVDDG